MRGILCSVQQLTLFPDKVMNGIIVLNARHPDVLLVTIKV